LFNKTNKERHMQIHELAHQILIDGTQERTKEFDSFEAGQVLQDCATHASHLERGEFSKTEHGYAAFIIGEIMPGNDLHSELVDFVQVRYVNAIGYHTIVGSIIPQLRDESVFGVVSVYRVGDTKGSRIKPEDERWGTIVGCVRDAVKECETRKAAQTTSALSQAQ
jgi:hypothetical protein